MNPLLSDEPLAEHGDELRLGRGPSMALSRRIFVRSSPRLPQPPCRETCSLAIVTTWSGVKPNLVSSPLSGAEAPNVCMPTIGTPPPDVARPAERCRLLHGDARGNRLRQHLLLIGLVLLLEQFPGRHADDARRDTLRRKLFGGGDAERDLAARADQDHLRWRTAEVRQHIGAARNARGRSEAAAIQRRQRLPAQDQAGGLMLQLAARYASLRHLIGIAGPQRDQPRHGAKPGQLFNRLVGRSVLADADQVVREDVERPATP